jgi:hypothetical protein
MAHDTQPDKPNLHYTILGGVNSAIAATIIGQAIAFHRIKIGHFADYDQMVAHLMASMNLTRQPRHRLSQHGGVSGARPTHDLIGLKPIAIAAGKPIRHVPITFSQDIYGKCFGQGELRPALRSVIKAPENQPWR